MGGGGIRCGPCYISNSRSIRYVGTGVDDMKYIFVQWDRIQLDSELDLIVVEAESLDQAEQKILEEARPYIGVWDIKTTHTCVWVIDGDIHQPYPLHNAISVQVIGALVGVP